MAGHVSRCRSPLRQVLAATKLLSPSVGGGRPSPSNLTSPSAVAGKRRQETHQSPPSRSRCGRGHATNGSDPNRRRTDLLTCPSSRRASIIRRKVPLPPAGSRSCNCAWKSRRGPALIRDRLILEPRRCRGSVDRQWALATSADSLLVRVQKFAEVRWRLGCAARS